MEQDLNFSKIVVVERAHGKSPGFYFIKGWVAEHWSVKCLVLPSIRLLE